MQLIDGKATAAAIKAEIAEEVKEIVARGGKQPHLAAVLVGHDGGSETYVKNKVLACSLEESSIFRTPRTAGTSTKLGLFSEP